MFQLSPFNKARCSQLLCPHMLQTHKVWTHGISTCYFPYQSKANGQKTVVIFFVWNIHPLPSSLMQGIANNDEGLTGWWPATDLHHSGQKSVLCPGSVLSGCWGSSWKCRWHSESMSKKCSHQSHSPRCQCLETIVKWRTLTQLRMAWSKCMEKSVRRLTHKAPSKHLPGKAASMNQWMNNNFYAVHSESPHKSVCSQCEMDTDTFTRQNYMLPPAKTTETFV